MNYNTLLKLASIFEKKAQGWEPDIGSIETSLNQGPTGDGKIPTPSGTIGGKKAPIGTTVSGITPGKPLEHASKVPTQTKTTLEKSPYIADYINKMVYLQKALDAKDLDPKNQAQWLTNNIIKQLNTLTKSMQAGRAQEVLAKMRSDTVRQAVALNNYLSQLKDELEAGEQTEAAKGQLAVINSGRSDVAYLYRKLVTPTTPVSDEEGNQRTPAAPRTPDKSTPQQKGPLSV